MAPRPEIFAALALALGLFAGWNSGSSDSMGGVERTAVGAASLTVANLPPDAACLRVHVAGSRTELRTFSLGADIGREFALPALPVGRDVLSAETFSVPCAELSASAMSTAHSEPTVGMISAGDRALIAILVTPDVQARVVARK